MSQIILTGFDERPPPPLGRAVYSPSEEFRYLLTRELGGTSTVVFVMLNPSTATAEKNDPTISRCIEFAKRWGFGRLVILNLCAYRQTKPALMFKRWKLGLDIVGSDNDATIEREVRAADRVVLAWGANAGHKALRARARHVVALIQRASRTPPLVLRHTKDGHPEHPLYIPGAIVPVQFNPAIYG